MWNPNTGERYIFDEDEIQGNYYNELWNINKEFDLYYQQYLQEQQQHVLQIEQLQNKRENKNQNLSNMQI